MTGFTTRFLPLLCSLLVIAGPAQGEVIPQFSAIDDLNDGWEALEFPEIERHSSYELVTEDGVQVVKARTDDSASGLITMIRVEPAERPVLSWRWKVSGVYERGSALRKNGDDYPARIYVAFEFEPDKAGWFERMKRKAVSALFDAELPGKSLNYIWANRLEVGDIVQNPFSEATQMIAVNSGNEKAGTWVSVERNIVEDYRAAFGEEPPAIVGIGIMSDSDNTGASATAWYGDINLRPAQN
ncbi:DUF3047 domain-containing protein [Marinobacter salicampi]|uniref:DUF3047 domain-containing protein n=1 Tax=Marinobacter salicampi TaxID=435907 RepID=UPI00140E7A9C|nr:DUF3047 domain-containing protein [Marinobacter salicampi]